MNIEQEKMIVEALPSLYPLHKHEEDAIRVVLDAIPHWIPVTERLPIEYDNPIEFLCTLEDDDGNRYVDLILWTGCDWENNYTDDNEQNKYGIDKVVGWMLSPIPMRKGKVTE